MARCGRASAAATGLVSKVDHPAIRDRVDRGRRQAEKRGRFRVLPRND
jgi:hypothetical protein